MRRPPLRSLFVLGVLAGLVLALARALSREGRPGPAPLAAPPAPLPAPTPPVAAPVPVELAPSEPEPEPEPGPEPEPVSTSGGNPPDPIAGTGQEAWVEPVDGGCPEGYPIKAKVASGIYHQPGGLSYERTRPDRCYADPASAESDGFRAAKR
jgi:hypothetical protein